MRERKKGGERGTFSLNIKSRKHDLCYAISLGNEKRRDFNLGSVCIELLTIFFPIFDNTENLRMVSLGISWQRLRFLFLLQPSFLIK